MKSFQKGTVVLSATAEGTWQISANQIQLSSSESGLEGNRCHGQHSGKTNPVKLSMKIQPDNVELHRRCRASSLNNHLTFVAPNLLK